MLTVLVIAAAVTGLVLLFAAARHHHLITAIDIAAPPDRVWGVLADGPSYSAWNPFIVRMEGPVRAGATLVITLQPAERDEMVFRPTVLVAEAGRELRWLGRFLVPRLFDGEHYFVLEPIEGGTRLHHGERFRGLLLWVLDAERFRANFDAMNAALKARAELAPSAELAQNG